MRNVPDLDAERPQERLRSPKAAGKRARVLGRVKAGPGPE
jgi:hypothetical protein